MWFKTKTSGVTGPTSSTILKPFSSFFIEPISHLILLSIKADSAAVGTFQSLSITSISTPHCSFSYHSPPPSSYSYAAYTTTYEHFSLTYIQSIQDINLPAIPTVKPENTSPTVIAIHHATYRPSTLAAETSCGKRCGRNDAMYDISIQSSVKKASSAGEMQYIPRIAKNAVVEKVQAKSKGRATIL
jgi:hypothetical protein